MAGGIMDFVQRFNVIERQRESTDELIKVPSQPSSFLRPFAACSPRALCIVRADPVACLGPPLVR